MFSKWIAPAAFFALSLGSAQATDSKPAPLYFTIGGWDLNGLTHCESRIDRAREMGFEGVAIAWRGELEEDNSISTVPGLGNRVVECMNHAWNKGMDVVFKPHVDDADCWSRSSMLPPSLACWRAFFDVEPGLNHMGQFLDPLLQFLKNAEPRANQRILFIASTELERSITKHTSEWTAYVRELRNVIQDPRVEIGINPNATQVCMIRSCKDWLELLREVDFIQPSLYGSYEDFQGIKYKLQDTFSAMALYGDCRESREIYDTLREKYAIGEFGIGYNLEFTEDWNLQDLGSTGLEEFITQRRTIVKSLLNWSQKAKQPPRHVIFWSEGIHDFTGLAEGTLDYKGKTVSAVIRDGEIFKAMREYHHQSTPLPGGLEDIDAMKEPLSQAFQADPMSRNVWEWIGNQFSQAIRRSSNVETTTLLFCP